MTEEFDKLLLEHFRKRWQEISESDEFVKDMCLTMTEEELRDEFKNGMIEHIKDTLENV